MRSLEVPEMQLCERHWQHQKRENNVVTLLMSLILDHQRVRNMRFGVLIQTFN